MQHIRRQLALRKDDALASSKVPPHASDVILHSVHSDMGVARNGGRRGARFGSQAVLAAFEKMTLPLDKNVSWGEVEVAEASLDELDFTEAQKRESLLIKIDPNKINIHLGGGHDHIYPLLTSLQSLDKPIHVVNVDAHLDTRTDPYFHSGTPFRQFADTKTVPFRLTQIGINPFSNARSNYEKLSNTEMSIVDCKSLERTIFRQQEITVFSLDCDALSCSFFSGVSAVNPMGLSKKQFYSIWNLYRRSIAHCPIIGIYEYNPIYDDPSGSGAKFLAAFIYCATFGETNLNNAQSRTIIN